MPGRLTIRFRGGKNVTGSNWSFYRLLQPGQTYDASCGLQITPDTSVIVESYEHFIEMQYAGLPLGRVSESMRNANAAGNSGPDSFAYEIIEDPCMFPPFTIGAAAPTDANWVFTIKLSTPGECRIHFWRQTLRQRTGNSGNVVGLSDSAGA